jgi:hypothetical protein
VLHSEGYACGLPNPPKALKNNSEAGNPFVLFHLPGLRCCFSASACTVFSNSSWSVSLSLLTARNNARTRGWLRNGFKSASHEIGRALGKEHSSIRCLVLRHGLFRRSGSVREPRGRTCHLLLLKTLMAIEMPKISLVSQPLGRFTDCSK